MKNLKYFPLFAFLFGLLSTAFAGQLSSPQLLSPTLGTTLSANAQPKFDWSEVSLADTYRLERLRAFDTITTTTPPSIKQIC